MRYQFVKIPVDQADFPQEKRNKICAQHAIFTNEPLAILVQQSFASLNAMVINHAG